MGRAPRFERRGALAVAVEEQASGVLLRVDGDLDLASIHQLIAALDRVDLDGITRLVVDLEQVVFLDLAGLKAILRLNEECGNNGVQLSVIAPRGPARRLFTLTRAHLQLDLVDRAVGAGR